MYQKLGVKIVALSLVVFCSSFLIAAFSPWSPSLFSYKTRHYGAGSNVAGPCTTISISDIGTSWNNRGSKHLSITNASTTKDLFVNCESARTGEIMTSTTNPGSRIGPLMSKDYEFTASQFECRTATGDGAIPVYWEVTQ